MREADLVRLSLGPLFFIGFWVLGRWRRRTAGHLLMLIGGLHLLGGAWVGRGPLGRLVRDGVVGAADSALGHVAARMEQELVFWFLLWGIVTLLCGQLVAWLEQHGKPPPAWIGWELLILSVVTIVLLPKGGFWFVLLPAFLMIKAAGHRAGDSAG